MRIESTSKMNHIHALKKILLYLKEGEEVEHFNPLLEKAFHDVSKPVLLETILELKNANYGITSDVVDKLFRLYEKLYEEVLDEVHHPTSLLNADPVQIFMKENQALLTLDEEIHRLIESNPDSETMEILKEKIAQMGAFFNHYNRKEKLYFPIMERYKSFTLPRLMWAGDDHVRTLYKGAKRMMENVPHIEFTYIKRAYESFSIKMQDMIFDEEKLLLPTVLELFNESNWMAIKEESAAFGFTLIEPVSETSSDFSKMEPKEMAETQTKHLPFGGGYLTLAEANIILNNLPLEITFVDKNGLFKYFNEKVEAADMMFIRTPSSIGRHVSNCHPPRSMGKVMRLIRELKAGKRTSETMWFKKKDKYIHITYKAVFDDRNEFAGILEYVQDIQPFFDLPREVKKELSALD